MTDYLWILVGLLVVAAVVALLIVLLIDAWWQCDAAEDDLAAARRTEVSLRAEAQLLAEACDRLTARTTELQDRLDAVTGLGSLPVTHPEDVR